MKETTQYKFLSCQKCNAIVDKVYQSFYCKKCLLKSFEKLRPLLTKAHALQDTSINKSG